MRRFVSDAVVDDAEEISAVELRHVDDGKVRGVVLQQYRRAFVEDEIGTRPAHVLRTQRQAVYAAPELSVVALGDHHADRRVGDGRFVCRRRKTINEK